MPQTSRARQLLHTKEPADVYSSRTSAVPSRWMTTPKSEPTKGDPAHAQSWGQIPKFVRDEIRQFAHPGIACNGHSGFLAGGGGE